MTGEVTAFQRELWRARRRGDRRLRRQAASLEATAQRRQLRPQERVRYRAIRAVLAERGLI